MSLDQAYSDYESGMEKWEKFIGLPDIEPNRDEIDTILSISSKDLKKLDSNLLSEYAFSLSQYGLFLQQQANRCQAFLQWSKDNLNKMKGDDKSKLVQWTRNISIRTIRISYLSKRIDVIIQALNNIVRTRYYQERT